jgi:hypothetical protein
VVAYWRGHLLAAGRGFVRILTTTLVLHVQAWFTSHMDKETNRKASMTFLPGKFYVMDIYAETADKAYAAGPFDTREDAAKDASERNIAGDLQVYLVPAR